MILKNIDDKSKEIKVLESLLSNSNSEAQKRLINADLKKVKLGYKSEKENAYYLDFEFEKSKNVIVLHDIRIEHNGRTAQFDHILISRLGIELLESKSTTGEMSINHDGSLSIKNSKFVKTYPNPLEQSKRHVLVLKELIEDNSLFSKRVNILGGISITSKVLINPNTTLTNTKLPDGFERADSFVSNRNKEIDNIGFFDALSSISKMFTIYKAEKIANLLVKVHTPINFDYAKKYRISKIESLDKKEKEEKSCPRCKVGKLIIRKTKSKVAKEKYNNDKFLGCSRYPKCRYTELLD